MKPIKIQRWLLTGFMLVVNGKMGEGLQLLVSYGRGNHTARRRWLKEAQECGAVSARFSMQRERRRTAGRVGLVGMCRDTASRLSTSILVGRRCQGHQTTSSNAIPFPPFPVHVHIPFDELRTAVVLPVPL